MEKEVVLRSEWEVSLLLRAAVHRLDEGDVVALQHDATDLKRKKAFEKVLLRKTGC